MTTCLKVHKFHTLDVSLFHVYAKLCQYYTENISDQEQLTKQYIFFGFREDYSNKLRNLLRNLLAIELRESVLGWDTHT